MLAVSCLIWWMSLMRPFSRRPERMGSPKGGERLPGAARKSWGGAVKTPFFGESASTRRGSLPRHWLAPISQQRTLAVFRGRIKMPQAALGPPCQRSRCLAALIVIEPLTKKTSPFSRISVFSIFPSDFVCFHRRSCSLKLIGSKPDQGVCYECQPSIYA